MTGLKKSSKTDQSDYWDQSYNSEKKTFTILDPELPVGVLKAFDLVLVAGDF